MRIGPFLTALILCACSGNAPPDAASQQVPPPQKQDQEPAGPIVFIGDSITARWDVQAFVPGAINAGIGGQTSCQMLARIDVEIAKHPATVVILGGINDISLEPDPTPQCVIEMAQRALAAGAAVIVCTLLPDNYWVGSKAIHSNEEGDAAIERFNTEIRAGAAAYGYTVADFYRAFLLKGDSRFELLSDGVHPNDAGYAFMQSILQPWLHVR